MNRVFLGKHLLEKITDSLRPWVSFIIKSDTTTKTNYRGNKMLDKSDLKNRDKIRCKN